MIKQIHRLWTAVIAPALLALSLLTSSCVEPLDDSVRPVVDPNAQELTIRIYVPGNVPATKAGAGDVQGIDPESRIYGVQVWMFNHYAANVTTGDDETAVSYAEVTNLNWAPSSNLPGSGYYNAASGRWTDGSIYELPLRIPGYVLDRPDAQMRFDFYVLANGASIGSPAARTMTRGQLKALTFGKTTDADWFGTTNPKAGTTPLNALGTNGPGLPISGFFNKSTSDTGTAASGVDLSFIKPENLKTLQQQTGFDIKALSPVVQLERAVSKIRFAFVRPTGMSGVQITKIEIDKQLIPSQTYVFPRETGDFLGTDDYPAEYYSEANAPAATISGVGGAPLLADSAIKEAEDPESLKSTSETTFSATGKSYDGKTPATMSAQAYSYLLDDYATSQNVYLRESSKMITGKIYYKLSESDTEQSASFTMTPDGSSDTYTNFHRNHSWIVYAYFQGGGLFIKPVLLPWEDGGSYKFTTPGTAFVSLSNNPLALFGYGWTTSTENTWYTAGKPTEWYFRRQNPENGDLTDPDYWKNDWVHSQMVVAPGLNLANAPIFANRIELTTLGFSERLILKLSDPEHFELVIYHSDSADYEVVNDPNGAVIPAAVTTEGITYFYVVPKDGSDNLNLSVSAYLITENSGQMIPFNANAFPGSNENTGIYFYSVSQDTFKGYYNTLPENVKAYDKDGEITI